MSDGIQQKRNESSTLVGWVVGALLAPGIVFGLAVAVNELHLIRFTSPSPVSSNIKVLTFVSGLVGLLTTPAALLLAWVYRASLPMVAKALLGLALFGLVAFILAYVANPFYR